MLSDQYNCLQYCLLILVKESWGSIICSSECLAYKFILYKMVERERERVPVYYRRIFWQTQGHRLERLDLLNDNELEMGKNLQRLENNY